MLDYNELFENQPMEVRQQLPEIFRSQLEEGTDAIILDEEELIGEYRGGELIRIKAEDFRTEDEDEGLYSLRLKLQGLIYPDWNEDGINEDEKGNTFFSELAPFKDEKGQNTSLEEVIPGESNNWLGGFKSYRIQIADMLHYQMVDESTYNYLVRQAKKWVSVIEEFEGDTSAPYNLEDDEGKPLVNTLVGNLTASYIDFQLDIRPTLQYNDVPRYGIHNIETEELGLKMLAQGDSVGTTDRKTKPKRVRKSSPESSNKTPKASTKKSFSRSKK